MSPPVPVESDLPESNWEERQNKTFADPATEDAAPSADPGFENPTRGDAPAPSNETEGPETIDAFRPPVIQTPKVPAPTEIIDEAAKPAPAKESIPKAKLEESTEKSSSPVDPFQKLPVPQPQNLDSGDTRLPVPVLKLNGKVAWKVVPKRERVRLHANYRQPTVARHKATLHNDWLPVITETKVAGK